jgi:hypothetical protein
MTRASLSLGSGILLAHLLHLLLKKKGLSAAHMVKFEQIPPPSPHLPGQNFSAPQLVQNWLNTQQKLQITAST